MIRTLATGLAATLIGVLLPACSSPQQSASMQMASSDSQALDRLYVQATAEPQFRRAHRKPVRDLRARAMRRLAVQADTMLAKAQSAERAAALTGEETTVAAAYEASLADLAAAARDHDQAALRAAYARVTANHP